MAGPWTRGALLGRPGHGYGFGLPCGVTALGSALPLVRDDPVSLFVSAVLFGGSFFSVVASTTLFVRRTVPRSDWTGAIGAMTVAFGLGQVLGPVVAGWIGDAAGGLAACPVVSSVLLAATAGVACLRGRREGAPATAGSPC